MSNRKQALQVVRKLREAGFEAFFAGGCVRDMLLGRRPNDYDVVTNAQPPQIIGLFRRTLEIGAKFGVVMALLEDKKVEVATFRTESGYADGRRPDSIEFTDARQDCLRRDFTVNGMFYDPFKREILDYVGGRKDIQRRLLRTIGPPEERFAEDYLRLLRAVRFAVQLDFQIEASTWSAVCTISDKIKQISAERISAELQAILTHPARGRGTGLLAESGLAQAIFPGLERSDLTPAMKVLEKMPRDIDWPLALAGFFSGVPSEKALQWTAGLKPSRAQLKGLDFLLRNQGKVGESELSLAQLKMLLTEPYFWDLYELACAELRADGQSLSKLLSLKKRALSIEGSRLRPKPLLNGHELIALGAAPGPMVGRLAKEMYIAQLGEQIHTARQAEKWAQDWLAKNATHEIS